MFCRYQEAALKNVVAVSVSPDKFQATLDVATSNLRVSAVAEAEECCSLWNISLLWRDSLGDIDAGTIFGHLHSEIYIGEAGPPYGRRRAKRESDIDASSWPGEEGLVPPEGVEDVDDDRLPAEDDDPAVVGEPAAEDVGEDEMAELEVNTDGRVVVGVRKMAGTDRRRQDADIYGSLKSLLMAKPPVAGAAGGKQDGVETLQEIHSVLEENEKAVEDMEHMLHKLQDKVDTLAGINELRDGVRDIKEEVEALMEKYQKENGGGG